MTNDDPHRPPLIVPTYLTMKRRNFCKNTVLGTAGFTTVTSTQTPSQPAIQWRMATSWLKSDITFNAVEELCQRVKAATNGRFVIIPYPAGEIVPPLQVFDAVQAGTVECGHTTALYYLDKNPTLIFSISVPFGLTAYQQNAWLHYGGGLEIMHQIYADFGIIAFPAGAVGIQMGGWFNKEMNRSTDFKGLKIRIPGWGAQILSRFGAEVIVLGGDEILAALEEGKIEAAEWRNPHDDQQLGLHRVARYYYYPGWWEPGASEDILVSRQQWQMLPKAYQQIFQAAATETSLTMLAALDAANGEALKQLVEGGIQLKSYSQEILQTAYQVSVDLLEENARQDIIFRDVYDKWKAFRRKIYQWNRINELSLERFVLKDFS